MRNDFFKHILLSGGSRQNRTELETETLPYTFNSNSYRLRNYRIYGNTVNGESVGNLVTEGEHAGEYCVPVTISNGSNTQTTNIYIPEQIRKIGDELEYIDYEKQKLYRIRKNLFNKNSNKVSGYISDDGTISISNAVVINTFDYITVTAQQLYSFKAFSSTTQSVHQQTVRIAYYDENKNYLSRSVYAGEGLEGFSFETPENCQYIRLSIDDNLYNNMLVKGNSIPIEYESFIEDIELVVPLPALPTLSGTNTLSVGTEVQPSKVYLQGKISEAEIVSAEPVQTNVQSLQPLSLDENAELDVMPSDKNEFQTNDISEMPVEDENSIEEILETENLETTGDDENAE